MNMFRVSDGVGVPPTSNATPLPLCSAFVTELRKLYPETDVLMKLWGKDASACTATPEILAETTARVQLDRCSIMVCVEHMLHAGRACEGALAPMRMRMRVADKLLHMLFRTSGQVVAPPSTAGCDGRVRYESEGVLVQSATGGVAHTFLMEGGVAAMAAAESSLAALRAHRKDHDACKGAAAVAATHALNLVEGAMRGDAESAFSLPATTDFTKLMVEAVRAEEEEAQVKQLENLIRQLKTCTTSNGGPRPAV